MRKIELKELKSIQLEILDDVDSFCRANDLRYSLCGGTLLGAVRHKGYIPWDDDIDILMPRKDYEIFLQTFRSEKNAVIDLRRSDYCREMFAKVERKGTKMVEIGLKRAMWGVNIDIFPVDFCPDGYERFYAGIEKKYDLLAAICPYYKTIPSGKTLWFIKYLCKRTVNFYPHSVQHLKDELDRAASRHSSSSCNFAGVLMGGYGLREIMPKDVFEKYIDIQFEGKSCKAVAGYDTYLTHLYHDYMQLPPKEQQVTHHLYDSYID